MLLNATWYDARVIKNYIFDYALVSLVTRPSKKGEPNYETNKIP